jgi:hypothetical protein
VQVGDVAGLCLVGDGGLDDVGREIISRLTAAVRCLSTIAR